MTQYQRITGKVFGGNATATGDDPQIAQFGSALANTFVGTTDPETIQSLPAWGQGFIGAVTPETQFPALPEMTGAMKVLSYQICGILQQGISIWDSGTIYYTGNFASKNGSLYISQIDENQGNDPETDTTNWKELSSILIPNNSSLIASYAMPSARIINLTLGASASRYTMPANGYLNVGGRLTTSSTAGSFQITGSGLNLIQPIATSTGSYGTFRSYCPVKKGDSVYFSYDNLTIDLFQFVYAQGGV